MALVSEILKPLDKVKAHIPLPWRRYNAISLVFPRCYSTLEGGGKIWTSVLEANCCDAQTKPNETMTRPNSRVLQVCLPQGRPLTRRADVALGGFDEFLRGSTGPFIVGPLALGLYETAVFRRPVLG